MKILAIEKDIEGIDWSDKSEILKEEASHVYQQYLGGFLREIYFTETKNAVLILEADSKSSAEKILNSFPLVQQNLIRFEVSELYPYTGLDRLFTKE